MRHTCHVPRCVKACPPAHLTCAPHWRMVPLSLQAEVYRTVGQRGPSADETWAPWWRAQAKAIHAIMVTEGRDKDACDRWLEHELKTAVQLEAK